jgi:uncharacterized UBP type Zn finger protein
VSADGVAANTMLGIATGKPPVAPMASHRPRRNRMTMRRAPWTTCEHTDEAQVIDVPAAAGSCPACLRAGTTWVSLRMCLTCGEIGCCDSSPLRHARAHHETTGHALIRSAEPGDPWAWCYRDAIYLSVRRLREFVAARR